MHGIEGIQPTPTTINTPKTAHATVEFEATSVSAVLSNLYEIYHGHNAKFHIT